MTYTQYLTSGWWSDIAAERKRQAQYRCECCGRGDLRLDVHHLRYQDDEGSILGRESLSDLEVLCRLCHLQIEQVKLMKNLFPNLVTDDMEVQPWWPEAA